MAIQRKISRKRNRALIGQEFPVLIEGPSSETDLLWECRMQSQAPEIDGTTYINDFGPGDPVPGQMRRLRVTEAHDYDVVGELVDVPRDAGFTASTEMFPIFTGNRPEASKQTLVQLS
jgi:ribosomal protein S12 methylthiotransferase